MESSSGRRIVGVHKGGIKREINGEKEQVNGGRVMTTDLITILELEARRMGSAISSAELYNADHHLPPMSSESDF